MTERKVWRLFALFVGIVLVFLISAKSVSGTVPAPSQRFIRQDFSSLDPTTAVDVVKDQVTGHCYAFYKSWIPSEYSVMSGKGYGPAMGVALLSYVPCGTSARALIGLVPAPIGPPASPIKK